MSALRKSEAFVHGGVRVLEGIRPLYVLPADPLADEVLIPCFKEAGRVDCMAGFFSSHVLSALAPGLATYIASSENSFRLIISPMLTPDDLAAIEEGVKSAAEVAEELLDDIIFTEDLIQRHTLKCLSWLLRNGRIEIKVALVKGALFHPKVWLFHSNQDVVVAHGSSNATQPGILRNVEQVAIAKSWLDGDQAYTAKRLAGEFERLWQERDENCEVVSIPEAVKLRLLRTYGTDAVPTEQDLEGLYKDAIGVREPSIPFGAPPAPMFKIPDTLQYEDGPFAHQGRAVRAWCDADFRGILEMATGAGKTITAMIAAHQLYEQHKPLLIVVAAPYTPLVQQWCDEIVAFGLRPINLTAMGRQTRGAELQRLARDLRSGLSQVEIVVVSHKVLCTSEFRASMASFSCEKLLIADEAHHLGSVSFVNDPPECFEHRLGLSATPIRQYDEEGTDELFAYFGDVVFTYSLKEAIGVCLVEYDYFAHLVVLSPSEMQRWRELTEEIGANAWRSKDGKPDDRLAHLLRLRREVLETAEGKISKLGALLDDEEVRALKHTLVYATDKSPDQLRAVNALLESKDIVFRKLTADETANHAKTSAIIDAFRQGDIRVLTAKRVLDEGVNIPQVCRAYILASTTVERQWVQRRGRLLRTCSEIGKQFSTIHDFVVVPDLDRVSLDEDARSLIKGELDRVMEFAKLSRNFLSDGGAIREIERLTDWALVG